MVNSTCTGRDCCGSDYFQVYPVYVNPAFQGCNIPRIPGFAATGPATPTFTSCFSTPSFISKKTTAVQYSSNGLPASTISRTVSFVATASPVTGNDAAAYINFGCYTGFNDFSDGVDGTPTAAFSVDSCVAQCQTLGKNFAGIRVATPGTGTCRCGNTGPSASRNNMEDCNQLCPGNPRQNCGPPAGLLVYAIRSTPNNPWRSEWSSSYSSTPLYSCTSMSRPPRDIH